MSGPMTAATPYEAPIMPVNVGLFLGSAIKKIIVYAPDVTPAAPRPAMARPTISVVEFCLRQYRACRWAYHRRVWGISDLGDTADQTSQFEDEDGYQEADFDGEILVRFAPQ